MSERLPDQITILHLEDNALDAELAAEMICDAQIECDIKRMVRLEDFQKALENYPLNFHYDMVLADFKLPGYDGMEALHLLRGVDQNLPFILVSGALGEELAVELLRNGATDYVLKHNLQRLPLVVRRALNEHQVRLRELNSQQEIRRARDEAEKANSAKGRFLGRISHELRTPLNAILGYTQLMQSDPMSEEQRHCATQILKAGEHLLQLINEVLEITKIESGVFSVHLAPTSISGSIERAVDLIRPMAREAGVTIHLDSGPCDLNALVDQDRLAQVIVNLLTNAVKYNRDRGHVYVECHDETSSSIKLLVRDTGPGIATDKLDRLFTPFDRLDADRETKVPGTGLGLTVSKALVEAMGGKIDVECPAAGGTIFSLTLPAAPHHPPDGKPSDQQTSINVAASLPPNCKVLLVEDHEESRDFMERVLTRRANVNFRSVDSVNAALAQVNLDPPDLIITDLNLPGGNGEELVQHINTNQDLQHIPVVVTSIDASKERKERLHELGAAAYFLKPLQVRHFLDTIADLCNIPKSHE